MKKTCLTVVILLMHQSLFAQAAATETNPDHYTHLLLAIVILLFATIFIGLDILGDPKYETHSVLQVKTPAISDRSIQVAGDDVLDSVKGEFKIAYYATGLLLVIYAVLIFLMF